MAVILNLMSAVDFCIICKRDHLSCSLSIYACFEVMNTPIYNKSNYTDMF